MPSSTPFTARWLRAAFVTAAILPPLCLPQRNIPGAAPNFWIPASLGRVVPYMLLDRSRTAAHHYCPFITCSFAVCEEALA